MAAITKFLTNSNGKMLVDSTTGKPLSLTIDVVNGLSIRLAERATVSTTYSTLASYSTTSQTYSNITNANEFAVGDVAILQWTITDRDNTAGIIFAEVSAVSSNSITAKGLGMSVKGDPGDDGAQIELQVANGQLQWKYDYQESWTNLIAMSELKGDAGDTPEIGDNGNWFVGGNDTGKPSRGENGATPTINSSGEWVIDGEPTGVQAEGADALMCVQAIETGSIPTEHDIERFRVGYFNRDPNIGDGCVFTYITPSGNPKHTYLAVGECTSRSVEGINTYYHFLINSVVEIKGMDGQNGQSALGYKSIIDVNSTPYTGQTIDVDRSGFVGDWTIGDLFYGVIRHAYSAATNVYLSILEIADAFTNCKILSLVKINGESGVNNVTTGTSTEQDGFTVTPIKFNFETGNSKTVNVKAKNGQDGAPPEIGENGNWFIDGADTGKPSRGEQGDSGEAATIQVGTVTTGAAGTQASVTNSGTASAATLNFTIPRGADGATFTPSVDTNGNLSWTNNGGLENPNTVNIKGTQGEAATVEVGTTTTLAAGSEATVSNSGTSNAAVLNFGIPKGEDGQGVPAGGTTGQVLKKKSDTDYDAEWGDESGGSGGGSGVEVVDLGTVEISNKQGIVTLTSEQFTKLTTSPYPQAKMVLSELDMGGGIIYQPANVSLNFLMQANMTGNIQAYYSGMFINGDWIVNILLVVLQDEGAQAYSAGVMITTKSISGTDGTTFTPAVDAEGNLSWTNDGGLENPDTVNIKGAQGEASTDAINLIPNENGAVNPGGRGSGTVGDDSTAIGSTARASGSRSTALGYSSSALTSNSTALGSNSNVSGIYSTALGYNANISNADSYTMQLGSSSSLSALRCKVNLTVTSDKRDKTDIEGITDALAFVERLNPVTFVSNDREYYISDEDKKGETFRTYGMCEYDRVSHAAGTKKGERRRCGLLAQEVVEAMQSVYGTDNYANIVNDNFHDLAQKPSDVENKYTLAYANLVPFLIGAIKELNAEIKVLESKLATSSVADVHHQL